jgi:hypothetical protein
MRGAVILVLWAVLGFISWPAVASGGQPSGATVSASDQLAAIPVYARVVVRVVDGRTLEGYLVAKTNDEVTLRPGKDPGRLEIVPVSAIASIRTKPEGRGLSRRQRIIIAVAVGSAVAVAAWVWAVKSRAFGA